MDRLIFQNTDRVPDDVIALVLIKGLPSRGAALYSTPVGEILVNVVDRRKSRVYTFYHRDNDNLLINSFTPDPDDEEAMKAFNI